jgi:hypothetical protein
LFSEVSLKKIFSCRKHLVGRAGGRSVFLFGEHIMFI